MVGPRCPDVGPGHGLELGQKGLCRDPDAPLLIRWRLMLNIPSSKVYTSNICQRKEELQTRKKGVKAWSQGKPWRGKRGKRKRL